VGANATETLPDGVFGWSDELCNVQAAFICKVLAAKDYSFASSAGGRFTLSTLPRDFAAAEVACNTGGGHLVHYVSQEEQFEVEQVGATALTLLVCWAQADAVADACST
jgi:hypothetical protein